MKVNIKWSICRICLEEIQSEGKSIFDYDEDKQEICVKIRECGGINIYRKSNLPHNICKTCLLHLNIAYRFRSVCQSSDEKLQTFLDKTEVLNKNINTDCSFLEVDDLILGQKNNNDDDIIENDDEQYFVYYADPDEIDDNPLSNEAAPISSTNIVPHLKQEYTIDEEYIIETEEEANKEDHIISQCKAESEYDIDVNKDKEMKNEHFSKGKPSKLVLIENRTVGIEDNSDTLIQQANLGIKPKKTKRTIGGDQQKYVCDVCGNQYDRKYTLQQHMKWHSDEKPYACELCGKAFVTEYQIHRHMRVHTGERPYKCQFCDRKFSDASTRMKHERIHTNVRPFKCDVCEKSFNYSDVLRVHKMTHSGEKPYSCDLCAKRFSQMHHLKAHLQTLSHRALAEADTF